MRQPKMTHGIKSIKDFEIHKDFGFRQVKCSDCLSSKLFGDKIFCYEWQTFVFVTHARICNRFVPRKKSRRRIRVRR